jgi:hypothetical protein
VLHWIVVCPEELLWRLVQIRWNCVGDISNEDQKDGGSHLAEEMTIVPLVDMPSLGHGSANRSETVRLFDEIVLNV